MKNLRKFRCEVESLKFAYTEICKEFCNREQEKQQLTSTNLGSKNQLCRACRNFLKPVAISDPNIKISLWHLTKLNEIYSPLKIYVATKLSNSGYVIVK